MRLTMLPFGVMDVSGQTPEQWQGVYEFAEARPGGAGAFPWDGYAARKARKADGR